MVRGRSFYAIWDQEAGMWSTDEFDVQRLIDKELREEQERLRKIGDMVDVAWMSDFSTNSWKEFKSYLAHMADSVHVLDNSLTFTNTEIKKTNYASKRLSYPLEEGSIEAYDEIIGTLYDPEERLKIEWSIGAIVTGDSKKIQKFLVLYGDAGTGKSTILNIVQKLFDGYYTTFEAKALASNNATFATEAFRTNPLVAIQHDGDLSKIEDNSKLNSIISHEEMVLHEKYKPAYSARLNCYLFMATNRPVKITDAKSGIIRRLIDVRPSGRKIPPDRYNVLFDRIDFELGAIAAHCKKVYKDHGKNYYNSYRPLDMMFKTDVFFNFVDAHIYEFESKDGISLKSAYSMYKTYCQESNAGYVLQMYKFREELKDYFEHFEDVVTIDGVRVRSYYSGFRKEKFGKTTLSGVKPKEVSYSKNGKDDEFMSSTKSRFDEECGDCLAQYARESNGTPKRKWSQIKTTLSEIDTSRLHYVKVPENHIVIDFDLKDARGCKSAEENIEAASKWPPTYAEFSKSGKGVHLHYIYDGDVNELSRVYDDSIEVKVFTGNSSLRRQLSKCNDLPIAHISSGLPKKGGKKVLDFEGVKSEKALRTLIKRNLHKEIHPGTKPSVDFIFKILQDAYDSGLVYDVSDMEPSISTFASNSTHHGLYCLKQVNKMKFKSESSGNEEPFAGEAPIVFFDVEVFPNLFIVVWKAADKDPVKMINPTPEQIEDLLKFRLVGFNNRRYDNHILYARLLGYSNERLYLTSQRIVSNAKTGTFREAYNLSYADIYDFSSKKQSLKKFEIELGIHHQELGLPWDEPVPEDMWELVTDYCVNDVVATEAVFNARQQDFIARKILSDLSGLPVNSSTQAHAAKFIFGDDPSPQDQFVYTDLSEMFEGYKFEKGKSYYRGEETGEGGYVYAEPGMYENVALLDIASMHPHSIIALNLFGKYTDRFKMLMDARLAIKHRDFDSARSMFDGKLTPYLTDESQADDLAYALKIIINIVYGLTSAKFENKFRDPRNVDNIVAKRGALFMVNLKKEVMKRGYTVCHIKTDSIKIPNADKEIIDFVYDYGLKYGYTFEHEDTYEKLCLVNNAVYIAKAVDGHWTATGAQFQHPYVFKKLFSKEDVIFSDLCETKTVTSAMYLDANENLGEDEHNYRFVGRAGSFVPIKPGHGACALLREKDGKYYAVGGTKDYRWLESEVVMNDKKLMDYVDYDYHNSLVDQAVEDISKYGDFEWFVS